MDISILNDTVHVGGRVKLLSRWRFLTSKPMPITLSSRCLMATNLLWQRPSKSSKTDFRKQILFDQINHISLISNTLPIMTKEFRDSPTKQFVYFQDEKEAK